MAARGAFSLCFLATFLLIVADSKAQGVTNRIAIAALFLIATGLLQYFHRCVFSQYNNVTFHASVVVLNVTPSGATLVRVLP